MIYVTSDIHGYYDEFINMLNIINFKQEDFIYIIGDVVDRGPDSIKLLQYVMKQANMQLLMGNHEQSFLWSVDENKGPWPDQLLRKSWLARGGQSTYHQFLELTPRQQQEIIGFLKTVPNYVILDEYLLVHAGIKTKGYEHMNIRDLMAAQKVIDLLWEKDYFLTHPLELKERTLIFGHTFTLMIREICHQPMDSVYVWKDQNRIGIDCGYLYGGKMVILSLDDLTEYYLSPSGVVTIKDKQGEIIKTYMI